MHIKPIKKSFDAVVDAVAAYNPEKKRKPTAKIKLSKGKRKSKRKTP
jgi:hypothetical protein